LIFSDVSERPSAQSPY